MKRSIHYKNILKTAVTAALCAVIILGTAACGKGTTKAEPSPSPSVEPTATPMPVEKVKVATINDIDDSLNVRSEASTDSEILGTAEAGEAFEVVAQDDTSEWVEISYFGQNAYVFAEFVTISEKEKTALATATPSPTRMRKTARPMITGTAVTRKRAARHRRHPLPPQSRRRMRIILSS